MHCDFCHIGISALFHSEGRALDAHFPDCWLCMNIFTQNPIWCCEKATLLFFRSRLIFFLNINLSQWLCGTTTIRLPRRHQQQWLKGSLSVSLGIKRCSTNKMQSIKPTILKEACGKVWPISWAGWFAAALFSQIALSSAKVARLSQRLTKIRLKLVMVHLKIFYKEMILW